MDRSRDARDAEHNYGDYASRIQHRLKELIDAGWFPVEYADEYVRHDMKLFPK